MTRDNEKPPLIDAIRISGVLLVAAVLYLDFVSLPALRLCVVEQAGIGAGTGGLVGSALGCLHGGDKVALLATLAAGIAFIALGWRERFAAGWRLLDARGLAWTAPIGLVALAALPYLGPGDVMLGDAREFQCLSAHLADVVRQGGNWYWSFYWYLGRAPYAFYGWLYWAVSGAFGALFGLNLANKLLLFGLHVGAAAAMFGFSRTAARDTRIAALAALGYGLGFDHFARVVSGRTQLSLVYICIPLLFWAWELRQKGRSSFAATTAWGAVLACCLLLTHQVDGAFSLIDFGVYALVRAVQEKRLPRVVPELAALGLLGGLLSSFWTVPLALEIGEVSASAKAQAVLSARLPTLEVLFAFVPAPFKERPLHYLGLVLGALACVGIVSELKARRFEFFALTVLSFALSVLQSPRHMPVCLFGIAASAGLGLRVVLERRPRWARLAVLGVCLETLPMTAQLGYPNFDYLRAFYSTLDPKDGERVLDLATDRRTIWASYQYLFGKDETVFGPLIEATPPGLALWIAIAERGAIEHYDRARAFSDTTLDAFYLLGAKDVIVHEEQVGQDPTKVFRRKRGGLGLERDLRLQLLDDHSVLVAAPRLVHVDPPQLMSTQGWEIKAAYEQRTIPFDDVASILERLRLDRRSATAAAIPVLNTADASLSGLAGVEPVNVRVTRVVTAPNRVTIDYLSSEAFLYLSYTFGKHLSLRIDGVETPFFRTALDTIAVKTGAGTHELVLEGRPSTARRVTLFTSAFGLAVVFALFVVARRRARATPL